MKNLVIVIPARFASTRFPGKPLVSLGSRPMIEYVYRACKESGVAQASATIIIATDDEKIFEASKRFISGNDRVMMTPSDMRTGTDRVAWAAKDIDAEFILDIQGDEPLLTGEIVDALAEETVKCTPTSPVATLVSWSEDADEYRNTNVVKAVISKNREALYFSRAPIPASRTNENRKFLKHIGLYGFRKEFLLNISSLRTGYLENIESLEQLRFLENGFGMKVGIVEAELMGVDTPSQAGMAEDILRKRGKLL